MKTHFVLVLAIVVVFSSGTVSLAQEESWPMPDWQKVKPSEVGMDARNLDEASAYAQKHGGGSGCVIRQGVLVKEWGDPKRLADIKSATKGAFGATCLGLAVDAGLVKLDDLAQKHYPALGAEKPENEKTGWLGEITVRRLATMTAGFDDGRPPKLVYRPGTKGIYSNDTSNMLAELLTLRFNEDLRDVVKRRVMDPIGAPADEWRWRRNNYRAMTIHDLTSREFASGLTITHRTLARIGCLYLRNGVWDGRRILSEEFIRSATQPTTLPGPFPGYAFYWVSNANGTFADIPRDTYWALGLGDSFVVVCPSLDVVAVRLGDGTQKSHLPGKDGWGGDRVAGFFRLVAAAVTDAATPAQEVLPAKAIEAPPAKTTEPPYPPSPVILGVAWAPKETIVRRAGDCDNWPMTWADDDHMYTAYGDGRGFDPKVKERLSLGLCRIEGPADAFRGFNIPSPSGEDKGDGGQGRKASGMLCVGGRLFMLVRNAGNSQLAWSDDHGATWTWSDWKFTTSFGCPTFLNFGKDYAGARDGYIYVYSFDNKSAYAPAGRMVLARVPKERITERAAYEFFVKLDDKGQPVWSPDVEKRGAVFEHKGRCYRSGITYSPALKRYLWCQTIPDIGGRRADTRFKGGFGIYDAPEPWGPWTTAYYTEQWDVGPGESASMPTKWMSADGRTVHMVFSGDDHFSVRKAVLEVAPD